MLCSNLVLKKEDTKYFSIWIYSEYTEQYTEYNKLINRRKYDNNNTGFIYNKYDNRQNDTNRSACT